MAMTPHDPSGGGAFPFGSSVPSAALPHQDALPLLRPSAVRLVRGAPERPIGLSYQPNSPCRRLLGSHPWRDEALVATDPSVSAEFLLQGYCRRWSVELTFFDSKQYLGLHDPRVWSERS